MSIGAPSTVENLAAAGRMPPAVVVMVRYTPGGARGADPGHPQYPEVIAKELVPWIRARYSVSSDPRDTVIGGYSGGAGAAGVIALRYPEIFGNALLQSVGPRPIAPAIESAPSRIHFYIDTGIYEDVFWGPTEAGELPLTMAMTRAVWTRRMRDVMKLKNFQVTYSETGGDHDDVHWRATLAQGLIALLGPRVEQPSRTKSDRR